MAQGLFEARAVDAGLTGVRAASAGTGASHVGEPPDLRAQDTARHFGIDISDQRAAQAVAEDFGRHDYILAMDRQNLRRLERIRPDDAKARLGLLLDYSQGGIPLDEVPDPYYGGGDGFYRVWELLEQGVEGLIAHLKQGRG